MRRSAAAAHVLLAATAAAATAWLAAAAGATLPLPCPELCHCYEREERFHVDCSGRELVDLPEGMNSHVQVLDLSNNLMEFYPGELRSLVRLEEINFAGNQLSAPIPAFFRSLERLEVLNLSRNKYDHWDNFGLTIPLEKLDLSLNFISSLGAESFRGMSALRLLDLSENRLSELPSNIFSDTYNLETLILSRNNLEHFPMFESASLEVLDLSMCQISNIDSDSFSGKSSLLEVDLSKNLIEAIPDLLHSNTLQTLDLSYNGIRTLNSQTFRALPHLAVLDLSGNDFEEVWTPGYFSENKYLRDIYLTGTRWGCEGFGVNLLLMYEYLTRQPPRVQDADTLICYTPANVTGWSWQHAYVLTWHMEESSAQSFTLIAVLAGLAAGALLAACLCRGCARTPPEPATSRPLAQNLNVNGAAAAAGSRTTIESAGVHVPLRSAEDSPPTYDEALLMPRLNGSFHSLPEYLEADRAPGRPGTRLSSSANNLLDVEAQAGAGGRHNRTPTRRTAPTDS